MSPSSRPPALLPLLGVMLLWPHVFTESVSSSASPSTGTHLHNWQGDGSPHVVKRATQSCGSTLDDFCLNKGQCVLLVDTGEHHCRCEKGFYGPRCGKMDLVVQPMREEQIIVIIFCVVLLIIGISGALYFCCKWYKNKFQRQQKWQGYKGVQTA